VQALVVWPPSRNNQPLELERDLPPNINPEAALLLAHSASGDKTADALFTYVRKGRLETARQAVPALIPQLEMLLSDKYYNPVHAILAAFTLQKVGGPEHPEWLKNLASSFQYLPDGALLYGWSLIRAGKASEAKSFFQLALKRGIPLYSEGVLLLRDGLSFLSGLMPDDQELQGDAARALRLAAVFNPHSELTCLRLGLGLTVDLA